MSYAKSVFFIPVWFDQFKPFTAVLAGDNRWSETEQKKLWASYLFRYACEINRNHNMMSSFTWKDPSNLNVYMFAEEMGLETPPVIDEVRLTCFATGVGFMEFWVSYTDMSAEQIASFAYHFKKATKKCGKELPHQQRALYDVALSLLPPSTDTKLFFSSCAKVKYECNCYHFLHVDQPVPDEDTLKSTLYRLSRSYRSDMPVSEESAYDMMYKAAKGDYWSGCTEGFANVMYDDSDHSNGHTDYYIHTLKRQALETNYYFMYLLLLNQKYTAVKYIELVAKALEGSNIKKAEELNKRIVQLKNAFSFNIISDDSVVQNLYSKMYGILEIHHLLEDVIENEKQLEVLLEAKQRNNEYLSGRFLMALSLLSLFSILIDTAGLYDRFGIQLGHATFFSIVSVFIILLVYIFFAFKNRHKY